MNQKLIEVLVGDKYRTLYLTNPQFKLRVYTLAATIDEFIPLVMDRLAEKAEAIQKDFNEQTHKKTMG